MDYESYSMLIFTYVFKKNKYITTSTTLQPINSEEQEILALRFADSQQATTFYNKFCEIFPNNTNSM